MERSFLRAGRLVLAHTTLSIEPWASEDFPELHFPHRQNRDPSVIEERLFEHVAYAIRCWVTEMGRMDCFYSLHFPREKCNGNPVCKMNTSGDILAEVGVACWIQHAHHLKGTGTPVRALI